MDGSGIRHLSVRVPWHDRGWDGTVCADPSGNTACLALSIISELKNDVLESEYAGRAFADLDGALNPPCLGERATFLSGQPYSLKVTMPYSTWSEHHKHIVPTSVEMPGWGGILVPYRWMLKESAWELAADWGLNIDPEREPTSDLFPRFMVDTPWVQNAENQRVMLDGFADQLEPQQSLVFFYAKQTPLADSAGSPIVAVGLIEHIGKVGEYPYHGGAAKGRIESMVWERPFQHSIRRNSGGRITGGVVLPYQEILALAKDNDAIDPAQYLAFPPEESRDQFLYGSEHVAHGTAIAALQAVRNAVEKIATLVPGEWDDAIGWIDTQINSIWSLRGAAPGLGSALTCIDPASFNGTLFAHALAPQLDPTTNPWPVIEQIFEGKRPAPFTAKQLSTMQKKRFELIRTKQPDRYKMLQTLSRFDLSKAQALLAFETAKPKHVVRNPYCLFEDTRFTETPIGLATIDQGLYTGGTLKGAWPLDEETEIDIHEADHPLRLRAATIEILERAAAAGDTLLSASALGASAPDLPISPLVTIDDAVLELCCDDFEPEIVIHPVADGHFAQLARYADCGALIRANVEQRLASPPAMGVWDWRAALDERLGGDGEEGDALEMAARQEKAAALDTLAANRIAILTGAAGSGKTTLLSILIDRPDVVGPDLLLLAPTGKARVRLGQQTGRPERTQTLAQFLLQQDRWSPETGAYDFTDAGATAAVSTCIIDEASMLTEDQLAALMAALPKACRLILVGDPRQLPPIGAGRPFVDLIAHLSRQYGGRAIAELRIGRRQGALDAGDLADTQLADLFSGRPLGPGEDEIVSRISDRDSDRLRFVQWDNSSKLRDVLCEVMQEEFGAEDADFERALELSLGAVGEERLYFNLGAGRKAESWQILTAHRELPHGSADLNRHIKRIGRGRRLEGARRSGYGWRMIEPRGSEQITYGDKVICVRNHHRPRWNRVDQKQDGYLANGEVGIVIGETSTERRPRWTKVEFATQPEDQYSFRATDFADHGNPTLELAYAVTVHKAQGSEFDAVMLVLPANSRLLSRELIYTALTRQRSRIWILHQGPFGTLLRLRSDYYSETARRTTNLFAQPAPEMAQPPLGAPVADRPTFLESHLVHATRRGDLVRSKSEIVIADILHELEGQGRIRYSFEKPLLLDGRERWPDFTIESGADIWFWEHCGMLDNPNYAKRWATKKAAYEKAGITTWSPSNPDGRLLITEDGPSQGLDSAAIHALASSLWG